VGAGDIGSLRVLLAEDHPINQKVAQLMLAKLRHDVDTVENGLEAVAAARRQAYDVVLMDVRIPELDGLGATARIRAELPAACQPRSVAVSAGLQEEERAACVAAGMDDFLTKPIRLQQLNALLSRGGARPSQGTDVRIAAIRARLDELGGPAGPRTERCSVSCCDLSPVALHRRWTRSTTLPAGTTRLHSSSTYTASKVQWPTWAGTSWPAC